MCAVCCLNNKRDSYQNKKLDEIYYSCRMAVRITQKVRLSGHQIRKCDGFFVHPLKKQHEDTEFQLRNSKPNLDHQNI